MLLLTACGKQNSTAPGMWGQTHTVRRGQCCNTPDLGHAACAGDVRLRDIECTALKQILEVEPRELALPRGNGDCRRSAHLSLTGMIIGRDRLLEPSDVVGLKLLGKLDGGRNLKRAVRVDHQFDVGAKTAASRLHPAHTVGDREAVTSHHTHLGSGEALRGVVREFRFGLVARRPPAARIAAHRGARRAKRLVERNPERLRPDVPYRDVDAGNCFHDDTAASAFIGLADATLERRPAARAVIHLFVDPLREHGILIDAFRRELMLDDGCDDRRRAESRADAGEAVVCFDADERRITLDLGSKVGAVTLLLRNGCRHWICGHFDDFHGSLFPVSRSQVNRRMSKPRYFVAGDLVFAGARLENRPKSSIPYIFSASRPSAVRSGYRRATRTAARYVEALSRGAAGRLAYWQETAQADGHPSRRLSGCRVLSTPCAAPPSSGSDRRSRRHRQERWRGLPRHGRGRAGRRSIRQVRV